MVVVERNLSQSRRRSLVLSRCVKAEKIKIAENFSLKIIFLISKSSNAGSFLIFRLKMSENMSLPFYFKFGASDVLSGLESTHGTRSVLLFSAAAIMSLCWRAGKALSIYLPAALSATTSRFPDRPRPMLLHSSCSAPFPYPSRPPR